MEDFYDLLGVPEDASTEEIDRAWRTKVRRYHPDVNDDERANAQFKTLKKAHEVLADDKERAAYDRMGHATYVDRRLDGLPTSDPFSSTETDSTDGSTGGRSRSSGRSTGSNSRFSKRSRTGSSRSSTGTSRSSSGTSRSSSGTSRSSKTGTSGSSSTGSRTSSRTSRTSTSTASGTSASAGTGASTTGASGSTRTGASTSSTTGTSRSSTTASRSRSTAQEGESQNRTASAAEAPHKGRSPLWYGWMGVLVAGVVYLAGLGQYLRANADALRSLRTAAASDPATALLGTFDLFAPGAYVLTTATVDAPLSLLFPVGAAALALAFLAVILSFGHGSAYLYLLGGVAPVVGLGAGTVATLPDGAVLALVAALPVVATVAFLVDVGRVLLGR